jgi:hypothetical protein
MHKRGSITEPVAIWSSVPLIKPGADGAGLIVLIFELHPDAVLAAPYDAAWKPQTVIRDDQREFVGNADQI